jgi:hypothetical protein
MGIHRDVAGNTYGGWRVLLAMDLPEYNPNTFLYSNYTDNFARTDAAQLNHPASNDGGWWDMTTNRLSISSSTVVNTADSCTATAKWATASCFNNMEVGIKVLNPNGSQQLMCGWYTQDKFVFVAVQSTSIEIWSSSGDDWNLFTNNTQRASWSGTVTSDDVVRLRRINSNTTPVFQAWHYTSGAWNLRCSWEDSSAYMPHHSAWYNEGNWTFVAIYNGSTTHTAALDDFYFNELIPFTT